ncbi:MAG: glutamine amidotransferase [Anaerolineales bacterium]|nr:glutamine amidotransferase [Anaerolineales bacterium]
MNKLLVIKTGSTAEDLRRKKGDFEDWIIDGMGIPRDQALIVDVQNGETLPDPVELSGTVITGSHDMFSERLPWSERTAAWLKGAVETGLPVLGICYGHQLLAHAMGGEVQFNPHGLEVGTVEVSLTENGLADPLLGDLGNPLILQVSHAQSVTRLPVGARLLASSAMDPHQAFSIGQRAWGVQFHPEFDAEAVKTYIEIDRSEILASGQDPQSVLEGVRDTPYGDVILQRFAACCGFSTA